MTEFPLILISHWLLGGSFIAGLSHCSYFQMSKKSIYRFKLKLKPSFQGCLIPAPVPCFLWNGFGCYHGCCSCLNELHSGNLISKKYIAALVLRFFFLIKKLWDSLGGVSFVMCLVSNSVRLSLYHFLISCSFNYSWVKEFSPWDSVIKCWIIRLLLYLRT